MKKSLAYLLAAGMLSLATSCDELGGALGILPDIESGLYAYYTFEGNTKNTVDGAYNATAVNAGNNDCGNDIGLALFSQNLMLFFI